MRTLTKNIWLGVLTLLFATCFIFFATAMFSKNEAKADSVALETEFTNNGEFAVGNTAWGGTHEFIDGTSVGGTGAVLKTTNVAAGTAGFRLNFTESGLHASAVESITVRVKAENFTLGSDEFRTSRASGSDFVNYGKSDNLSNWFDYTLNAATIKQLTNNDGTLGYTDIVIRAYTAGLILYVDSVTIVKAVDLEAEFTNDGQFAVKKTDWNGEYEFIDGTSFGGTGAVLKASVPASGTLGFKLDLTDTGLHASAVESIVVRVKADNYTVGTDVFRTAINSGSNYHDYSKQDDLNDWFEYTLDATSMAQLTNEDGTLGSVDIAIRAKTAGLIAYFDSVTITEKVDWEAKFTNDGQFAVGSTNWGGTHEFIDGTSVGGTGAVLKAGVIAGTAGFRLDFTGTGLRAAEVESIVVRIKAENFTLGTDFVRMAINAGNYVDYSKQDDLSDWFDYTLNEATMAKLTNEDGTLGYIDIIIRAYTAGLIAYFDSVTITEKVDVAALEAEFTNDGQFAVTADDWNDVYEYINGVSVGGTGAVIKVTRTAATGTAGVKLDFSNTGIRRIAVESIVVRVKADNFTVGTDVFRTAINSGTNFHDYSKQDDLNDWFEYTLDATSMAQLTNEDGTLGSVDIAIRAKTDGLIAYFDSVTVTMVESLESEFTNNWQFEAKNTDWGGTHEFIDGIDGTTGAVLKAGVTAGTAGFKLDLTNSGLRRVDVASIVVRVKADNFVQNTDCFKTAKDSGQNFHDYEGDDLSDWFEYTLDSISMAQLTNEDGMLGSIDIVVRAKSSNDVIAYFDSVTITIDESAPKDPTVVCQGIANDENNNIYESNTDKYRTLLKYDKDLGSAGNSANVVSTTGQGITLNGVSLSVISGASINYGHGGKYIQIRIPKSYQDALVDGAEEVVLEVVAGTTFESQVLDYAKFVLRSGQWAVYKDPEPIGFSTIFWNNMGGDVYAGKNGIMLSYSEYLSNVPNEVSGGIKEVNLVGEEIGEKIKLDGVALKNIANAEIMYFGTSLLWIYVPNMDTYRELTIESTEFLVAILPETHLAFFNGEWAESFKITHNINGEEFVTYCKKNGKTVLGAEYYSELFADKGLSVKLVSFNIGDTVYNSKQTLIINADATVFATVVGFETTQGAYVRLNNPTGIRFETKIDKSDYDYLVSVYGEDNVETGTYIVPKSFLGITAFDDYFADETKEDGVDYVKIVNHGFFNKNTAETDGYYKYYGSLVNIVSHNYTTDFFGIGYIKVNDGKDEYVFYGGNDPDNYSRSIFKVSKLAYNDFESETSEKAVVKGYLDGVVSIVNGAQGVEIENVTEGYVSPYSVNYNSISGEYTVSGASEIKSVLINGEKLSVGANLVNIMNTVYKLTNITKNGSTLKFKLTSIASASELVDFTVEMPSDREMRILQITDTQIIDSSQMRYEGRLPEGFVDVWKPANIDKNCFNYISALIENERPDLILLTGDIIYGEFDDSGEIWTRIIDFMDSFDIPWAPIFGNHDNESAKGVEWQCAQLDAAKNCLFKKGDLSGNGNYSIGLVDASGKIRRVIYMLDSHGCFGDVYTAQLYPDQINWFKSVSAAIDAAYGEEVPAFMCYHIPSLDFQTAYEGKYGYAADISSFDLGSTGIDGDYGQKNEKLNIMGVTLATDLKAANVEGVFVGHDHLNNYSILYDGIRYTYGTKTGTYDIYNASVLGGTLIRVTADGIFEVSPRYLDKQETENRRSASLTITFMSDMHFDEKDYGSFHCTQSEAKLKQIVSETEGSRFYINLGDTVNSLDGKLNNMHDAVSVMKELGLNVYNTEETGYTEDGRMIYNLCGNHEAAYYLKSELKDFIPYVDGVGSVGVFKYEDLMFVAVDALFDSNGLDDPETIFNTKFFTISDTVINWLKAEVASNMDETVKGIVWISHVALQDIDDSKYELLNELKSYGLPMTVFEGHTHIEAYNELTDELTNEVYCEVYTLPAVTLDDGYPYYNVTFKDGKVLYVDKHTDNNILNAN